MTNATSEARDMTAEELAESIVRNRVKPGHGPTCDPENLIWKITEALRAKDQRIAELERALEPVKAWWEDRY